MGNERITVEDLIKWLGDFPNKAEVCFVRQGLVDGVTEDIKEITVRPIGGTTPFSTDASSLVIIGLK